MSEHQTINFDELSVLRIQVATLSEDVARMHIANSRLQAITQHFAERLMALSPPEEKVAVKPDEQNLS